MELTIDCKVNYGFGLSLSKTYHCLIFHSRGRKVELEKLFGLDLGLADYIRLGLWSTIVYSADSSSYIIKLYFVFQNKYYNYNYITLGIEILCLQS